MTALKATTASKTRRRAMTVAALAAGAVLALTGCGAGQISQTAHQVAAVNGNSANVGKVALRDVRFLLPQTEQYDNAKGGKAVLAFSAANLGEATPDELVSITTDLGQVKINGKAEIKAQATLVSDLSTAAKDEHGATTTAPAEHGTEAASDKTSDPNQKPLLVEVTGLTKDVTPGLTYPVTFIFKEAGTVVVNVPVDAGSNNPRPEPAKSETKSGH
ncbi:hypothetical protein OHB26_09080 [Nocardia sp. NBC_01503]|uniref:hypothetical protein n=1 Tax=Nocardia sp. NBC_01503 TaxID=2975997 RepID=UPI002E7C26D0|nr:hypothetical protein [Nocardia sp. NBC_01503]WTL34332.1 hypothetical protein OHB26_09080 [Nocardia sp. NBC_01503]